MCAKNNTHIYVARTSNNRVISSGDLYCCLLPQCEALRTCRSGFPIATYKQKLLLHQRFRWQGHYHFGQKAIYGTGRKITAVAVQTLKTHESESATKYRENKTELKATKVRKRQTVQNIFSTSRTVFCQQQSPHQPLVVIVKVHCSSINGFRWWVTGIFIIFIDFPQWVVANVAILLHVKATIHLHDVDHNRQRNKKFAYNNLIKGQDKSVHSTRTLTNFFFWNISIFSALMKKSDILAQSRKEIDLQLRCQVLKTTNFKTSTPCGRVTLDYIRNKLSTS